MTGRNEHVLNEVLVPLLHAGNALAAALLNIVKFHGLALDVTYICVGNNAVLLGDKVLNIDLAADRFDLCASCVVVLLLDNGEFVADNVQQLIVICKYLSHFLNECALFLELIDHLGLLHAGESAEPHLNDSVRLSLRQRVGALIKESGGGYVDILKALNKALLAFLNILAGTEYRDDLVNEVDGNNEALEDMFPFQSLFKIILSTSCDNVNLKIKVILKALFQSKYLRLTVNQSQHDNADGILKLSIRVQLIEHYICVCVALELNNDTHTVAVGFIADNAYALNTLVAYKVAYAHQQTSLVYHVGYLVYDNACLVVLLDDVSTAAQDYLAASGIVSGAYSAVAHDDTAGREIRTLYLGHELLNGYLGIVDHQHERVNDLTEVVRRDIRSHTNRDTVTAVYEQVRET